MCVTATAAAMQASSTRTGRNFISFVMVKEEAAAALNARLPVLLQQIILLLRNARCVDVPQGKGEGKGESKAHQHCGHVYSPPIRRIACCCIIYAAPHCGMYAALLQCHGMLLHRMLG